MRVPAMVSFMRFRQRRNVDLPQPEGPMSAVMFAVGHADRNIGQRLVIAVEEVEQLYIEFMHAADSTRNGP